MAMAARRERGLLDPDAKPGESPFDHKVFVIASDGDLQEGVTSEASSLAGTQELGNLVVLWDDNHISIEDDTNIAFSEDVLARYEAYGWDVHRVSWIQKDGSYVEDVDALKAAYDAALAQTGKPSIIGLRTIIGWPSPGKQNTGAIHGSQARRRRAHAPSRRSSASTRRRISPWTTPCSPTRARSASAGPPPTPSGTSGFDAWRVGQPRARHSARPHLQARTAEGMGGVTPGVLRRQGPRDARRLGRGV